MKKTLFFSTLILAGLGVFGQEITAVTGVTKGQILFNDFRKIDENNLTATSILLTKSDKITVEERETQLSKICSCGQYIAAMTESTNGDLVYIPMHSPKLAIIDAGSKNGTIIDIPNSILNPRDQSTFYARMTTASDGYMYALNNIGTELLKISSNGSIQNLGSLPAFGEFAKSSGVETSVYGGDMIADAFGNIYVLTASANVFKVNPNTLKTDYLGKIKGLPEAYTLNAAAVERDGSVLLGSSSTAGGFYTLDFSTLEAKYKMDYNLPVYDLASNFFLKQDELNQIANLGSNYSLYPTIVKNSQLNIVSKSDEASMLSISVWDINQKQVYTNTVSVKSVGEYQINLRGSLQPGIYILKVVNQNGIEVINTKFTLVR